MDTFCKIYDKKIEIELGNGMVVRLDLTKEQLETLERGIKKIWGIDKK